MQCRILTLSLGVLVAACQGTDVAPATIGNVGGADVASADGKLGDGAAPTADAGAISDGGVSGGTETAAGTDAAVVQDGAVAVPDTALGPDNGTPVTDSGQPTTDGAEPLPDGVVTPDVPLDAAQPDGAVAKYQLCSQLLTCVWVACGNSADPNCAAPCLSVASPLAAAGVAPYLNCAKNNCIAGACAKDPSPKCIGDCVGAKCMMAAIACGADGKYGPEPCPSAFGCLEGCKDKGPECSYGCYAKLSKPAQAQMDALFTCAAAAGDKDAFEACPSQALTCIAGGKTGSGNCTSLFVCMDSCNSLPEAAKVGCLGGCWGTATPAAQSLWIAISKCMQAPAAPCGQTFATCAEPKGTKTCLDALGCWDGCDKAQKKADCHLGCLSAASPVEATKAGNLLVCMGAKCDSCKGDKTCESECTKTKCKTEFESCLK
ncbi:MAG: hypothetical protein FJ100_01375 [Deltaproteobacteria bacterium]|nr:hypothetical protein [Deltaproteobacteria bacterium]